MASKDAPSPPPRKSGWNERGYVPPPPPPPPKSNPKK
jgi:hypothetical protein